MMAVSIPVYCQRLVYYLCFLSMPAGIHLGATYVHTSPAGARLFSSPYIAFTLPSVVSEFFSGISSVSVHISTITKGVKCLQNMC